MCMQDVPRFSMQDVPVVNITSAKPYLLQVRRLDAIVQSKLNQIEALRSQVLSCTSILSDTPPAPHNPQSRANAVARLVDLENEINADIDALVDVKREVSAVIYSLENALQIEILTRRYFEYQTWEQIAFECHVAYSHTHRIHQNALDKVQEKLNVKYETK